MIAQIIFIDIIRASVLCILSFLLVYLVRNTNGIKKKIIAFVSFELIMIAIFLWILIVGAVMSDFSTQTITSLIGFSRKWIFYHTAITALQFLIFKIIWNKSELSKVSAICSCIFLILISLPYALSVIK